MMVMYRFTCNRDDNGRECLNMALNTFRIRYALDHYALADVVRIGF